LHVELALVKISNLIAKKKTSTPTNPVVKPDPGKPAPPGNERISTVGTGKSAGTVKSENPENNIDTGTKKEGSPTKTNIQYPGQTISIKKAFNKNKQGEHVERDHHISTNEAPERYGNKPIDKKELEKEYREFVQKYKDERPRIYSTLNNQTPDLKDEHILVLKMNNSTQHEEFKNDVKQQLINYLKRKLENGNITIEIEISKTTSKNTLYTDDEKFVYMSKKNPNLNILKQKFNLDFE
jgi:DNA polymerase III alpha subunit (gram-positive type)